MGVLGRVAVEVWEHGVLVLAVMEQGGLVLLETRLDRGLDHAHQVDPQNRLDLGLGLWIGRANSSRASVCAQ
jgi:hypothetical protein